MKIWVKGEDFDFQSRFFVFSSDKLNQKVWKNGDQKINEENICNYFWDTTSLRIKPCLKIKTMFGIHTLFQTKPSEESQKGNTLWCAINQFPVDLFQFCP